MVIMLLMGPHSSNHSQVLHVTVAIFKFQITSTTFRNLSYVTHNWYEVTSQYSRASL